MLIVGIATPVDGLNFMPFEVSVAYFAESEKYDSSAVTRLRRSDFIAAMYAFDLVFANFGIAIAARMPMITTTMSSSMRVKPRRVFLNKGSLLEVCSVGCCRGRVAAQHISDRRARPKVTSPNA